MGRGAVLEFSGPLAFLTEIARGALAIGGN